MSVSRPREMEELAGVLFKEFTRSQEKRAEELAARERWLALSPEERDKQEKLASEERHPTSTSINGSTQGTETFRTFLAGRRP